MKISVRKEELEKALSKVSCALGEKNDDVITKNIGIETKGNKLRFVASSRKICAEYILNSGPDLIIEKEGKIVVDGPSLIRNVSNLHTGVMLKLKIEESVSNDGNKNQLNLGLSYETKYGEKWDHSHNLLDVDFFPEIDFSWDTKHIVKYPASNFINGISKAVSAASDEVHRPSYNAVMIGFGQKGVEFFASDGRQMAYTKDSNCISQDVEKALIQSQVIAKIAKKSILDISEDLEISISPNDGKNNGKVRIKQNEFTIITSFLEDATCLPYENILNLSADLCSFTLNAGLLKDDLRVFSDLENKDSKWTFSKDGIKVVSLGNFDRKSEGFVSGVKDYNGKSCEVRLSIRYWDSLLSKCDNDTDLKVSIANERLPISIEVYPDPYLYRFFIMPITDISD